MSQRTDLSGAAPSRIKREQGVALVVALVFLMVLTLIGVAAMQSTNQQEMMASNARQRNMAFQGAEACVRWAETGSGGTGWGATGRSLRAGTLPVFNGSATWPGLRQPVKASEIGSRDIGSFWSDVYCWTTSASCATAQSQACPPLADLNQAPRFVIEELQQFSAAGSSAKFGELPATTFFRVTARSLGGTTDAAVIVQTVFKR